MIVISSKIIREFVINYPEAATGLNRWYELMVKGDFCDFSQMKTQFSSCDSVGNDRFVFNVSGNRYRLVSMIHFSKRTVYIRFIGTHNQYDKIDCSKI
ncbi:MAG: type II toxin-antitoxin system HigB family toxin [Chitinophagia bacterium]|jgi:mRNA interferase HigB